MYCRVISLPTEGGKSPQQIVEAMNQRILALGAVRSGQHVIGCDVFHAMVPQAAHQFCFLMHNTEYPVTTFAILDSHTCVTSDNILDLLMIKMKPLYESRKNLNIECKGTRFEYNDFLMKTATVQSVTTKSDIGVLLEVEYLPSVVASNCYALLKEMSQSLCGRSVEIPAYVKLRGNDQYKPSDTMQQYLEYFNAFKKSQSSTAGLNT